MHISVCVYEYTCAYVCVHLSPRTLFVYIFTHTQCSTAFLFSELANRLKARREQQPAFKNRRKETWSSQSQVGKGDRFESHEEVTSDKNKQLR